MSLDPSTGLRDEWLFRRPAIKTDLINKIITVPTFSQTCGPIKKCGNFTPLFSGGRSFLPDLNLTGGFTLCCWIKPLNQQGNNVIFNYKIFLGSDWALELSYDALALTIDIRVAGTHHTATATKLMALNDWNFVSFVYDGSAMSLYLNARRIIEPTVVGVMDTPTDHLYVGIRGSDNDFAVVAHIAEVRIYNAAKTQQYLDATMFSPRDRTGQIDTDLKGYVTFRQTNANGQFYDLIQNIPLTYFIDYTHATTEDGPPIKYGASFSCLEFPVSLDTTFGFSFQYPVIPLNTNRDHALYVRWTDPATGDVMRKCLYHAYPDAEDVGSGYDDYAGEYITPDFVLEIYNVDGAESVNLEEEFNLILSQTTQPSLGTDRTQQVAATLQENNLLSAPFPLVFPITFTQEQTYT